MDGFKGAELCISSDDIFDMEELPESMTVLGGGYIGCELAQILQSLGVKTTLIVRSRPLRFLDQDILDLLLEEMRHSGMTVLQGVEHDKVEQMPDGKLRTTLKDGTYVDADKVLSALGRPPATDGLGLENTQIKLDQRSGHILTDEYQNTHQSGVYALGDVTKGVALTPVAVRAGRILSERLFNNRPTLKMNYENVATVVFTHPPLGTVGLNEMDAKAKFGEDSIKVYKSQFVNMYYGLVPQEGEGAHRPQSVFKLVTHFESDGTERVVGAHGMGRGIDEMM